MTLAPLGPVRVGTGAAFVLSGAPAYAGLVWRVIQGNGALTPGSLHADATGTASVRYDAAGDVPGTTVRLEVDVYA